MNPFFNWPESLTRFVNRDSARAEDVNDALDQVSAGFDMLGDDLTRAIKMPPGSLPQELALNAMQRAGLLLGFDAAGNVTAIAGGGRARGDWASGVAYAVGDNFRDPATGNLYAVLVQHTSTSIAADLASSKVLLSLDVTDVKLAKIAAETAASAASGHATSAAGSATTATNQAALATTRRGEASTFATNASASATAAASSAGSASSSATLAQNWAAQTSGEVVVGQGFSAKKYAADAATSAASINPATYLNRANHTGSQDISTISGLSAALGAKLQNTFSGLGATTALTGPELLAIDQGGVVKKGTVSSIITATANWILSQANIFSQNQSVVKTGAAEINIYSVDTSAAFNAGKNASNRISFLHSASSGLGSCVIVSASVPKTAFNISPTGNVEFPTYTRLGSDAPAVRHKKITGVMPAVQGGFVYIPHGVTGTKIISATCLVNVATGWHVAPGFTEASGPYPNLLYCLGLDGSNIILATAPSRSADIVGRAFTAFITYEE